MTPRLLGGLALLLCCEMAAAGTAPPTVTLSGPETVAANSTLSLILEITGLYDYEYEEDELALGAWDLTLAFDPTRLSGSSVLFGDPELGDQLDPTDILPPLSTSAFDGGAGILSLGQTSLVSVGTLIDYQASDFVLAEILFTVGSIAGPTTLTLCTPGGVATCLLGDAYADPFGFQTEPTGGLTIFVEAPEPGSWLLVALAAVFASRQVARRAPR